MTDENQEPLGMDTPIEDRRSRWEEIEEERRQREAEHAPRRLALEHGIGVFMVAFQSVDGLLANAIQITLRMDGLRSPLLGEIMVTGSSTSQLIETFEAAMAVTVPEPDHELIGGLVTRITELNKQRNLVAHGKWSYYRSGSKPKRDPSTFTTRKTTRTPKQGLKVVTHEFTPAKLEGLAEESKAVASMLGSLCTGLECGEPISGFLYFDSDGKLQSRSVGEAKIARMQREFEERRPDIGRPAR